MRAEPETHMNGRQDSMLRFEHFNVGFVDGARHAAMIDDGQQGSCEFCVRTFRLWYWISVARPTFTVSRSPD
jgi:hypothetical protein